MSGGLMRRMGCWLLLGCLMGALVALTGCASNTIHRSRIAQAAGGAPLTPEALKAYAGPCHWRAGQPNPHVEDGGRCGAQSVESGDQYALFFVEFDEQGRMYDDRQFDQLFSYLEGRVSCNADLSIVVFVHGWRHNARYDDGNVALARQVLAFTFDGERAGKHPNQFRNRAGEAAAASSACAGAPADQAAREVVGIYVGWRGKSMDGGNGALLSNWELPSVFDRKNVAQSVAVGSVRELFSRLRVFQYRVNGNENQCKQGAEPFQCKRVRMLIVGHSFGGLLVFNAVSSSIMDSLNAGADVRTDAPGACLEAPEYLNPSEQRSAPARAGPPAAEQRSALVRSFADLIVLVNPAIEGVRFEPLHQALQRRMRSQANQLCPNQKPVMVVITADNDYATRYAFRVVRAFSTLLEDNSPQGIDDEDAAEKLAMRRREERESSINTMGHVERFQTHDLVGVERLLQQAAAPGAAGAALPALQTYCAAPAADALDGALKACRCGARRWLGYVTESIAAGRYNCPAYVEELNTAEAMTGTFSALLPAPASGLAEGQSLYQTERWRQAYCGGAVLAQRGPFQARDEHGQAITKPWARTLVVPNSPIWMVKSYDKGIVNNHSGIDEAPLKLFIRQVYHDISIMNFDRQAFDQLNLSANRDFRAECEQPLAERRAATP